MMSFMRRSLEIVRRFFIKDNSIVVDNTQIIQKLFIQSCQLSKNNPHALIKFCDAGFRVYSQNDEDGFLLYIFSLVGLTNKRVVEICAGNGFESNTANLIINHHCIGLLFDGDHNNVSRAKKFYETNLNTKYWPPTIVHAWITAENINTLISQHGFNGQVDLLSIDIDGVDYWIWKAITTISPRVVVVEFNHLAGPYRSISIPYNSNFKAHFTKYGSDYAGASLQAFVALAKRKGYRLIGTNTICTNAFFLRNDIQAPLLNEIQPAQCFTHPRATFGRNVRWESVKNFAWEQV